MHNTYLSLSKYKQTNKQDNHKKTIFNKLQSTAKQFSRKTLKNQQANGKVQRNTKQLQPEKIQRESDKMTYNMCLYS